MRALRGGSARRGMVACGASLLLCGLLPAPAAPAAVGQWTSAGRLLTSREFQPATALTDGRVLVNGGFSFAGIQASAELFDSATQRWENTFPMRVARFTHSSTLLPDGRV